jgi:hypothetical protein
MIDVPVSSRAITLLPITKYIPSCSMFLLECDVVSVADFQMLVKVSLQAGEAVEVVLVPVVGLELLERLVEALGGVWRVFLLASLLVE